MKLLLTGGLGFIGTNFSLRILNKEKWEKIIILDNLSYPANKKILKKLLKSKKFSFIRGDVCNYSLVNNISKNVDAIIHFAGETSPNKSIKDSKDFFRVNVLGTHSVVEGIRNNLPNIKKFLNITTDFVWGESLQNLKSNEKSVYNPSNPYSASKAAADYVVKSYGKTYGIPYNIIYFSNLFGPYQYPEKLIPKFINLLLLNQKVNINGDGSVIRDWLFINDACDAIEKVLGEGRDGESYCFGGDSELSVLEVTKKILKLNNLDEKHINFIGSNPKIDRRYVVDFTKAKKELNWVPKTSFEEGLKTTIKFYRENVGWWKRKFF